MIYFFFAALCLLGGGILGDRAENAIDFWCSDLISYPPTAGEMAEPG